METRTASNVTALAAKVAAAIILACACALCATAQAHADEGLATAGLAAQADETYALLASDGYVYPSTSAGAKASETWDDKSWYDIQRVVNTLYVAADCTSIPKTIYLKCLFKTGSVYTFSGRFAYASEALQKVVFLTNSSGRSAVRSIADSSFSKVGTLQSVTGLEKTSLEVIGDYAFQGTAIPAVSLPATVENIGAYAFQNCAELASVGGLASTKCKALGNYAFQNCAKLASVALPTGLTDTGANTFAGCTALASVNFGNSLVTLNDYAFQNCTALTSADLPATLKTYSWSFTGCTNLESLTLRSNSVVSNEAVYYKHCGLDNTRIYKLSSGRVYVPGKLVENYKSANPWGNLENKIVAIPGTEVKQANTLTVKAKTATFKAKSLKKKAASKKALTISNAKGKVSVENVSTSKKAKKFKVSANGKVKAPKKTKKGTYKVKVKVTAAGNASYKPATKTVTLKVKVK